MLNGNPAPQLISTASNSLTLTAGCADALTNVKVTVKVNNANYKTYTSSVSRGQASYSMTGNSTICPGITTSYTIDNVPCNSTISWIATGTLSITGSSTGTSVTVVGNGNGSGNLTATASGSCSGTISKTIQTGYPVAASSMDIFDPIAFPEELCPSKTYRIEATFPGTYNQYYWVLPYGWTSPDAGSSSNAFTTTGPYALIKFVTSSTLTSGVISVRAINECGGYGDPYLLNVSTENCSGRYSFTVYPNPASDELIISSAEQKTEGDLTVTDTDKNEEYQIILYNDKGKALRSVKEQLRKSQVKIDTRQIPDGTYFLHITKGKEITRQQIIIKH